MHASSSSSRVHKPEQRSQRSRASPDALLLLPVLLSTQLDHDLKGFLTELQQACEESRDDDSSSSSSTSPQNQDVSSSSSSSNGSEEQLHR